MSKHGRYRIEGYTIEQFNTILGKDINNEDIYVGEGVILPNNKEGIVLGKTDDKIIIKNLGEINLYIVDSNKIKCINRLKIISK